MKWNWFLGLNRVAEKVNGAKNTSKWFQTNYISRVMECGNLCEIEDNVRLMFQLKKDLKEQGWSST